MTIFKDSDTLKNYPSCYYIEKTVKRLRIAFLFFYICKINTPVSAISSAIRLNYSVLSLFFQV